MSDLNIPYEQTRSPFLLFLSVHKPSISRFPLRQVDHVGRRHLLASPFVMFAWVHWLIVKWESYQVELHGRYSVAQLMSLAHYEATTTKLHALAVLLLTPLPCTAMVVGAELIPLNPPFVGGLSAQGAAYWMRTLYSTFWIAFTLITKFSYCSPGLPLSTAKLTAVSLAIMTSTSLTFLCLHLLIGFPTPFVFTLEAVFWQASLVTVLWVLWGDQFRSNINVQRDLARYAWFWNAEMTMLVVYPAMTYVFQILNGFYQSVFLMTLPIVKISLKNLASYGVYRLEQWEPVCVTFSVDVFHAMFYACAMQTSRNAGTLAITIAIDVFQSLVAVYEIRATLKRIRRLGHSIELHDLKEPTHASPATANGPRIHNAVTVTAVGALQSTKNPQQYAVALLDSNQELREHPQITLPRHGGGLRNRDSLRLQSMRASVAPGAGITGDALMQRTVHHEHTVTAIDQQRTMSGVDQARLCYVQETAQLMYMVEFYLLIELTEVLMPTVYSIYLGAMFYLPNRSYFIQLKTLTDEQYLDTLVYVAEYAAYELLSLLVLGYVFGRMLGVSPIHHLAFTLEKNARLAQTLLAVWVYFPIQMALDHLGNDYTMKFEWLHQRSP